jgi:hypothetical protein
MGLPDKGLFMTFSDIATIAVASRAAILGSCGLCTRPQATLSAAVAVTQGAGTVATFDICEYCERALRRLEAVTPGPSRFAVGAAFTEPGPVVPSGLSDVSGPEMLVQEFTQQIQDGDGALYTPVAVGAQRVDGTWTAWLEFREMGGARVLRTNRETTQPNWTTIVYWASGLQPSYLEGAFRRAARPHAVRIP